MGEIKVLIVEDRDVFRDGLKLSLLKSEDIKVTGEAANGYEAVDLIMKNDFDVVIMDINMPKMNGVDSTKKITSLKPNIKVLANSIFINPENVYAMVQAGAIGFIAKGEDGASYEEAIRTVAKGAIYLSDEISYKVYDKVLSYLKHPSEKLTLSI